MFTEDNYLNYSEVAIVVRWQICLVPSLLTAFLFCYVAQSRGVKSQSRLVSSLLTPLLLCKVTHYVPFAKYCRASLNKVAHHVPWISIFYLLVQHGQIWVPIALKICLLV